ncbi:hypothetical protein [Bradyrhizobium sp. USDA 4508]
MSNAEQFRALKQVNAEREERNAQPEQTHNVSLIADHKSDADVLAEAFARPLETRNQRDAREITERDAQWDRERAEKQEPDAVMHRRIIAEVDQRIEAVRARERRIICTAVEEAMNQREDALEAFLLERIEAVEKHVGLVVKSDAPSEVEQLRERVAALEQDREAFRDAVTRDLQEALAEIRRAPEQATALVEAMAAKVVLAVSGQVARTEQAAKAREEDNGDPPPVPNRMIN